MFLNISLFTRCFSPLKRKANEGRIVNLCILSGSELYPGLQAAVSSLSAGPVGPGDMINGTNATLLMR